ncbi:hypothetical protein Tco_1481408, partial [Tanacetum coccineum]
MSVQNEVESESSMSDVTNLNFFDFVESETTANTSNPRPNNDEKGPSHRDGSVHQPDPGSSNQSGYDEQHTVTPTASHGLRRSNRPSKLLAKLNEYVLDNKSYESSSFEEPSKDVNWISAINDDMHALYENDTWYMTDLLAGRKPIGSTDENECTKFKQFLSNKFKIKDLGEL